MAAIPAPTLVPAREEWLDADFDLPEGVLIHASSDKDDEDEDWDLEMNLSQTGGAKANAVVAGMVARLEAFSKPPVSQPFTIRPPLSPLDVDEEDDEGVSTIKVTALSHSVFAKPMTKPTTDIIDEDFEDAFALPSDLTQLSLAPLSLNHRSSKNSLEWGDKDNSSSSQSSDAYSTLGFAEASPSSNSTSSVSLPDTETEDDDDGDELEGLVIPLTLFESKQSGRQLTRLLETKKKAKLTSTQLEISTPDPEDDFEMGLIIDDDVDLSPSRLLYNAQHQSQRHFSRSNSMPPQRPSTLRPPSRPKLERAKSPANPPTSSARQLQKLRLSPSPPLRPPSRSQTFQSLSSALPSPSPSSSVNFLSPKPGSLRGQKSHSGLKPPTPPATTRKLTRKASLSFLMDTSSQASGSGLDTTAGSSKPARYDEPTASSRAKTHKCSTSRLHDFKVPPTRPSTPSSNPAALRLTLPTQSRLRSRPALSQVFGGNATTPADQPPALPSTSPIPPRPPSSLSLRAASRLTNNTPPASVPKLLRRPKRQRTYGDGTELDGIEDLPTDRDKEGRFRVQPKATGNRIPGASYTSANKSGEKPSEKGTLRRKGKRDGSATNEPPVALAQSTNTLRRTTTRIEFPPKTPFHTESDILPKRKKNPSSPTAPGNARRKPTLIRNLGGAGGPKVVGDMKWNPHSLRWEGNDQVLRDFDAAVGTSTRPALITQLTGSSIGSPAGVFASGARVVGNMFFDPARMCWISTLPPEEDEPDVFANLADDEEDGTAWESKGGTIRASLHQRVSDTGSATTSCDNFSESSNLRMGAPSPAHSHTRTLSESGSERGSRASMVVRDVDEAFLEKCRDAEERHRAEMKGWKSTLAKQDLFINPDRSHLYEIRALATRKY